MIQILKRLLFIIVMGLWILPAMFMCVLGMGVVIILCTFLYIFTGTMKEIPEKYLDFMFDKFILYPCNLFKV